MLVSGRVESSIGDGNLKCGAFSEPSPRKSRFPMAVILKAVNLGVGDEYPLAKKLPAPRYAR
jgi:hypothetical protein